MDHMKFLIGMMRRVCDIAPPTQKVTAVAAELDSILSDESRIGTIPSILRSMRLSTANAKDLWSEDTRRILNQLQSYDYTSAPSSNAFYHEATDKMSEVITNINAFVGLSLESMTRDGGWLLLDCGRRIEQAQFILAVLIETLGKRHPESQEPLIREAVLVSLDSLVTYRRTYTTQLRLDLTLELMLLDPNNPRSLLYQVNQLERHILKLPETTEDEDGESPVVVLLRQVHERISLLSVNHLLEISEVTERREGLIFRLRDISDKLSELARSLDQLYFRHADNFKPITGEVDAA